MAKSRSKKRSGYKRKAPYAPIPSPPETTIRPTALPSPTAAAKIPSPAAAETLPCQIPPPTAAEKLPPPAAAEKIPYPTHVYLIEDNPAPPSLKNIWDDIHCVLFSEKDKTE